MLSEPMQITYDLASESLNRVSFGDKEGRPSEFVTSDGEFRISISEIPRGKTIRFEVYLERIEQDADSDPFTGHWSPLPNGVGIVFEVNSLRYNSSVDLPLLQQALLDLVDGPFRDRVISGEK